jgi:hypothetical protein
MSGVMEDWQVGDKVENTSSKEVGVVTSVYPNSLAVRVSETELVASDKRWWRKVNEDELF